MITIENLTKYYGKEKVLDDVSIYIPKGMVYGLIGKSGVGKSTLLRCINGLEGFNEGRALVNKIDVKSLSAKEMLAFRRNIGMVFQQFSLLGRMTVAENVALPMRCWKMDCKHIRKKVPELLEMVGLPDKADSGTKELSGGQKQRVAIARALAMNPGILLCDEATSALDPKTTEDILALLGRINREFGLTIVVVTHEMDVLKSICNEISILEGGRVAASGELKRIFMERPAALKNLLGEKEAEKVLPEGWVQLTITIPESLDSTPVITGMARSLNTDYLLMGSETDYLRDGSVTYFRIWAKKQDVEAITGYLGARGIRFMFARASEGELL